MSVFQGHKEIGRIYLGPDEIRRAYLGVQPLLDQTSPPPAAPVNRIAPEISGAAKVGGVLVTTTGTWDGTPLPDYSLQWCRDGDPVPMATAFTYVVGRADIGTTITCNVTAKNSEGNAQAESNGLAISAIPEPASVTWPETVLAAHLGREGDVSPTLWRDDSGHGQDMTLVGSPVEVDDGDARAIRFDGVTQYGIFAPGAFPKTEAGFTPVNIAVTARFPVNARNKALIGDSETHSHIVISDSNSSVAVTNNIASLDGISIGAPTENGMLSDEAAIVDGVDDSQTVSALQTPDTYQTIIIRQATLQAKWTLPHLFERRGARRWDATAAAVTVWTGNASGDEARIIANHWRAVTGNLDADIPKPVNPPEVAGTDNSRLMEYANIQAIPLPEGTQAGQRAFVALYAHGSETMVVPPSGWQLVERASVASNTWMDVFSGKVAAGQTSVVLTLAEPRDASGVSVVLTSGEIGQSRVDVEAAGSLVKPGPVQIGNGGTVLTFLGFQSKQFPVTSTGPISLTHDPANKSFAKKGLVCWTENAAGSESTPQEFTYGYVAAGAITVAVEATNSAGTTADLVPEFDVGSA